MADQLWFYVVNQQENELRQFLKDNKGVCDLNRRDASGRTLLDYCCPTVGYKSTAVYSETTKYSTYIRIAKQLLDNGSDPNATDQRGWTIIHQCAIVGDLTLLSLCMLYGANSSLYNHGGQLPVDLAYLKKHGHIVEYLEKHSLSLKRLCRVSIRDAMGPRAYNRINELPLPPSQKLFINYGNPFVGWVGTLYVPRPWSDDDIRSGRVDKGDVLAFFVTNASSEFMKEKEIEDKWQSLTFSDLAELFESLYFWESFKTIDYEEPLARKPRYALEKLTLKDDDDDDEEERKRRGRERNRREGEKRPSSGFNFSRVFRRTS